MSIELHNSADPLVSVCLITYNHERFIAQALDGALRQETDFPFEIIVANDCSRDATGKIVRQYAEEHPHQIRVLERKINLGANHNFKGALAACTGKYIALLDGDDFWTSPFKLKKQAAFLEATPNHVACFHTVTVIDDRPGVAPSVFRPRPLREKYELADVLRHNEFATCSAMIRKVLIPDLPDWYCEMVIGDWPLYAMLAQHGLMGFIDEDMATYRIHAGGAWSGQNIVGRLTDRLAAFKAMSSYFQNRQDAVIHPAAAQDCIQLAQEFEKSGKMDEAKQYALRAAKYGAITSPATRKKTAGMFVRLFCPTFYRSARFIARKRRGESVQAGNS